MYSDKSTPSKSEDKQLLPPYDTANRKLEWNYQTFTFLLSMVVQAIAMGLSIYALVDSSLEGNSKPQLLMAILILELVVQVVELCWYIIVGVLYYFGGMNIGVEYRYYDWVITTPTMLISILLFIWYLQCNNLTLRDVGSDLSKVAAMLVSLCLNWFMLMIGYVYEARITSVTTWIDSAVSPINGLYFGFVPFLGSYVPIFISAFIHPNVIAIVVSIVTFLIWLLYGVVAIWYTTPEGEAWKNTFYNLLDIVSKNLAGITIAIVSLMYTSGSIDATESFCNVTST